MKKATIFLLLCQIFVFSRCDYPDYNDRSDFNSQVSRLENKYQVEILLNKDSIIYDNLEKLEDYLRQYALPVDRVYCVRLVRKKSDSCVFESSFSNRLKTRSEDGHWNLSTPKSNWNINAVVVSTGNDCTVTINYTGINPPEFIIRSSIVKKDGNKIVFDIIGTQSIIGPLGTVITEQLNINGFVDTVTGTGELKYSKV